MCIENRADLPHPCTEVLTPQVVANRMNWSFLVYLNGVVRTLEPAPMIWPRPSRRKKTQGLNFYKDRKYEFRSTDAGLKSWTLEASLIRESRI